MEEDEHMIDSLIEEGMMKKCDVLIKKQVKLDDKKREIADKISRKTPPEIVLNILDVSKQKGYIIEQNEAKRIEEKVSSGNELDFDDWIIINNLYKSNINRTIYHEEG